MYANRGGSLSTIDVPCVCFFPASVYPFGLEPCSGLGGIHWNCAGHWLLVSEIRCIHMNSHRATRDFQVTCTSNSHALPSSTQSSSLSRKRLQCSGRPSPTHQVIWLWCLPLHSNVSVVHVHVRCRTSLVQVPNESVLNVRVKHILVF